VSGGPAEVRYVYTVPPLVDEGLSWRGSLPEDSSHGLPSCAMRMDENALLAGTACTTVVAKEQVSFTVGFLIEKGQASGKRNRSLGENY